MSISVAFAPWNMTCSGSEGFAFSQYIHSMIEKRNAFLLTIFGFSRTFIDFGSRFFTVVTSSGVQPWSWTRWSRRIAIRFASDLYLQVKACISNSMFKCLPRIPCKVCGKKKTHCSDKTLQSIRNYLRCIYRVYFSRECQILDQNSGKHLEETTAEVQLIYHNS